MKTQLKKLYYGLNPAKLPTGLQFRLGYIFHTEQLYIDAHWQKMLNYCKAYYSLTGAKAISTIIPPTNPMVHVGLRKSGLTEAQWMERVEALMPYVEMGYHGHFWFSAMAKPDVDPKDLLINPILTSQYHSELVEQQVRRDVEWFASRGIDHNGLYAAGWWMQHPRLLHLLASLGFRYDFSFSQSPWFRCPYSVELMRRHQIKAGQPMRLRFEDGQELVAIQNLTGFHTTPFPQDALRLLADLCSKSKGTVYGVLNSHDYDLASGHTQRALEVLLRQPGVQFLPIAELLQQASDASQLIGLPDADKLPVVAS